MANITDALESLRGCLDEHLCGTCPTTILAGAQPMALGNDLAWVRLVNSFPSRRFPAQDVDYTDCGSPLAYVVELGIIHCLPVQQRAPIPTPEQATAMAKRLSGDMMTLRKVATCCLGDGWEVLLNNWTPLGPQGAIVGGTWTITIAREYGDD